MANPLFDVQELLRWQADALAAWHDGADPVPDDVVTAPGFQGRVLRQHLHNCRLWRHEDQARRTDVDDARIAELKRTIDRENQKRNDAIEQLDEDLLRMLEERERHPPDGAPMNSETPGSMIDRLSILALKVFRMRRESERGDADEAHRERCRGKLAILERQRRDLAVCLDRVLEGLDQERLRLVVYRQFKMYNDPSLNPALYRSSQPER
ncbi:MAG: DUF4254 domain-containing protein [Alphaproteobacteria bacterium]